jgi:tRNA(Ile)-lysidine synthase
MNIDVPAGRYVVAVSGGVDSIALLHMLATRPDLRLTIAHYDHGIRPDSVIDRKLVQLTAKEYGLPFVYHAGKLGPDASEAIAREARYQFLHAVRRASGAKAVITAHHQDDVLETAILNMLRGTGRRGLSALKSTDIVLRPLLHVSKQELARYAAEQGLVWREDSTNGDDRYLRNYIRHQLLPRFDGTDKERLATMIKQAADHNTQIAQELEHYLHVQPGTHTLDRHAFIMLPHAVAREVMAEWLLMRAQAELSRILLERLVVAAKTGRAGTKVDVNKAYWLRISPTTLALEPRER